MFPSGQNFLIPQICILLNDSIVWVIHNKTRNERNEDYSSRRGAVLITTAQLYLIKPEFRLHADSNPASSVLEMKTADNMSQMEIKINNFDHSKIQQKQFIIVTHRDYFLTSSLHLSFHLVIMPCLLPCQERYTKLITILLKPLQQLINCKQFI